MFWLRAAFCAALSFVALSGESRADDVTLTSRDGTVTVSGTLLAYDGEFFRVETRFGVLTVDGSGVTCEGPGCPDLDAYVAEIALSGTRTIGAVLMPALIEAFAIRQGYRAERIVRDDRRFIYVLVDRQTEQTAARMAFNIDSTASGFDDLVQGRADLVMAARLPTEAERRLANAAGIGDLTRPERRLIIGLDGLVPIVSPANAVRRMSLETLAQLLAGDLVDWEDLGGAPGPIRVHLRDEGSGPDVLTAEQILGPAGLALAEPFQRHAGNAGLSDAVARDAGAFGLTSYSHIDNARAVLLQGTCDFPSPASVLSLKSEDYPLTTPLFLFTGPERLPLLAREFLAFVRSPAAAPVIRRAGFVDLVIEDIPLDAQGERLANAIAAAGDEIGLAELQSMVSVLRGATRLSVTFRFRDGTAELDAQSLSNVDLLADQLEAGRYDDTPLLFVGFSDGSGAATANRDLARRRAETVRQAVLEAAPFADRTRVDIRLAAFGEALPMACDDSAWGRKVNRRVEVWRVQR